MKSIVELKKIGRIAFVGSLLFMSSLCDIIAQGPPPPGDDPGDVPIDGGISLLLAAGISYGAKKFFDERKRLRKPPEKEIIESGQQD